MADVRRPQQGPPGFDGASAYEIARAKGFVGTVDQWLSSLRGEQGQKGERGEKGEDGQGPDQAQIDRAIAQALAAIPVPADGKQGPRGPEGQRGPQGKDGTPAVLPPLVPWTAQYFRDARTLLTNRVRAGPADGSGPRIDLIPVRRADMLIDHIEIIPL